MRRWSLQLVLFAALLLPIDTVAQEATGDVLVVSRARILTETRAAQHVRQGEALLRVGLSRWLEQNQARLAEREEELTELRGTLTSSEFGVLTREFDLEIRSMREQSQAQEAAIQAALREARGKLVTALYPVLIEILRRFDAAIILDADQILIAAPRVDVTDDVIALYNEQADLPEMPQFDDLVMRPRIFSSTPQDDGVQPGGPILQLDTPASTDIEN